MLEAVERNDVLSSLRLPYNSQKYVYVRLMLKNVPKFNFKVLTAISSPLKADNLCQRTPKNLKTKSKTHLKFCHRTPKKPQKGNQKFI